MMTGEAGWQVRGCCLQSLHSYTCLEFSIINSQHHDCRIYPLHLHLWSSKSQEERDLELWYFTLTHEILEGLGLHKDINSYLKRRNVNSEIFMYKYTFSYHRHHACKQPGCLCPGVKKEGPALRGTPTLVPGPLGKTALATFPLGSAWATWSRDRAEQSFAGHCWNFKLAPGLEPALFIYPLE